MPHSRKACRVQGPAPISHLPKEAVIDLTARGNSPPRDKVPGGARAAQLPRGSLVKPGATGGVLDNLSARSEFIETHICKLKPREFGHVKPSQVPLELGLWVQMCACRNGGWQLCLANDTSHKDINNKNKQSSQKPKPNAPTTTFPRRSTRIFGSLITDVGPKP